MNDSSYSGGVPASSAGRVMERRAVLPCDSYGLRRARSMTRIAVRPIAGDAVVDSAEICVDEAFCNAWRHTWSGAPGGTARLRLHAASPGPLWIELADDGPLVRGSRPRIADGAGDPDSESGRGLFLIDCLAASWSYSAGPGSGLLRIVLAIDGADASDAQPRTAARLPLTGSSRAPAPRAG
ncbi:ATP-binding protein [Nocardiopsis coralliicola]